MNPIIPTESNLWQYLSPEQQKLAADGQLLLEDRQLHPNEQISDYSYLVFPYAKLYEGFLKQLFRDLAVIADRDYRSDHFRIGKVLSPNLVRRLGPRSAYGQIERRFGRDLADRLWHAWKEARNLVFHYFPHNYRALTQAEALKLVRLTAAAMSAAVEETRVKSTRHEL